MLLPTVSTAPAQRPDRSGLPLRSSTCFAAQDLFGAQPPEVLVAGRLAGDRRHVIAQLGQQGDGERPDAAAGARDHHVSGIGRHAVLLQGIDAQPGREAGGAQDHAVPQSQPGRQRDDPLAGHPDVLRPAAPAVGAHVEPGDEHRIALATNLPDAAGDHAARGVHAGDMRETAC